jgi:bifunctional non-homologous end joining protein LigD
MSQDYERKRDFTLTPEPEADPFAPSTGPLKFVVQMHTARRLHWDLRLECDGVLKSWAVPKGPSLNPEDRRLAVQTEDHPLSYAEFEGVIPKGQYGGGEMIVWDMGVYVADDGPGKLFPDRNETQRRLREGLKGGKLSFTLYGRKLKGSFTLVKTSKGDWLLIKHKDAFCSNVDLTKQLESVKSGLTNDDLAKGEDTAEAIFRWLPGAEQKAMPGKPMMMLPVESAKPFSSEDWGFELKLDGIRALAIVENGSARLISRSGREIAWKFPLVAEHLGALPIQNAIFDGEVVRFDDEGKPSFEKIMERFNLQNERDIRKQESVNPVVFCMFDLVYLNGWDLSKCALGERRRQLERLSPSSPSLRVLDLFENEGELLFQQAIAMGFEGVIAKKLASRYRFNERHADWQKVKAYHTEEFLIRGYTDGEGSRASTFGALVLANREDQFVGAVGGGFTDRELESIAKIIKPEPTVPNPFSQPIDVKGKPTFIEPKHWVEVRYQNMTSAGHLRIPIYQRMRPDLEAPTKDEAPRPAGGMLGEIAYVLEQLQNKRDEFSLEVEGQTFKVSSASRQLWPERDGFAAVTKRDLMCYYAKIAPLILPHLKDRPLSLVRYPDGLDGEHFYQKHVENNPPDFVEHVNIWSSHNERSRDYVMCNNLATLVWLGQMSTLEVHPWYSRISGAPDAADKPVDFNSSEEAIDESVLNFPDFMVFDLDPYIYSGKEKAGAEPELNRAAYLKTVEVAMGLKEMLDAIGLRAYPKTSGKTGLHIYAPLRRQYDYDQVKAMAETFGRHLMALRPDDVTMEWAVKNRPGRIFFDHNQNVRGKTLCAIYSPRAVLGAPVSFPMRWERLAEIYPTDFTVLNVNPDDVKDAQLWVDILRDRQTIG